MVEQATKKLVRLDLACGQNKTDGFLGVDIERIAGVDLVFDLNLFPWPWEDSYVDEIFCSHYVEHVYDLISFMDEAWRILKPNAHIKIVHPYLKSDRAFQDPTHVRFIPDATWWYFTKEWREAQKLDHYPIKCDFELVNIDAAINPPWNLKSMEAQQFALQHYWNVASDLSVDLRAIK